MPTGYENGWAHSRCEYGSEEKTSALTEIHQYKYTWLNIKRKRKRKEKKKHACM
jgi:hypothetical protein